jgi:uncharacterized protein
MATSWPALLLGGLISGILAGFLGIGGGTVLVPLLVAIGHSPLQSVATSSLAILITAISGTVQNFRMGFFNLSPILALGLPALIWAQLGVYLAAYCPPYLLLAAFALLLLLNIYLLELRRRLDKMTPPQACPHPLAARILTGGVAGLLAGMFGVGGGVIMVPLQVLLLAEPIKVAIQTSLGVIVISALSAAIGHALAGNILLQEGIILGWGGLIGAQISTRFLPRLPDQWVSLGFKLLLGVLSIFVFWQSWQSWRGE